MQLSAIRKAAASKLMLVSIIIMILRLLVMLPMSLYFREIALPTFRPNLNLTAYLQPLIIIVALVVFIAGLIRVAALLMIYADARSGGGRKTAGYTILYVYMGFMVVVSAVTLLFALPTQNFGVHSISDSFKALFELLIAIGSVKALLWAKEIVESGAASRKFPVILPISLIGSICVTAAEVAFSVAANTIPALAAYMPTYLLPSASEFLIRITYAALGLAGSFLFLLLSLRAKKALSQQTEDRTAEPTEA